jgi:putative transposase
LERWYYLARDARDPVAALRRRRRRDAGQQRGLTPRLMEAVRVQYREHPGWTVQLHYDNLAAWGPRMKAWGRCLPMPRCAVS